MADAPRSDHDDLLPAGLLAELAEPQDARRIRPDEVARARQHVAARSYDDGEVVEEIASQLLALSRP